VSSFASLLEVQALDLECDRLRRRREGLPARAALAQVLEELGALDAAMAARRAEVEELARAERLAGSEVASIGSRASEVETALYSGTVRVAKELEALQEELGGWARKKVAAEERELGLLEQIESAELALADQEEGRRAREATARELEAELATTEQAIDAEIARLEGEAAGLRAGLPQSLLAAYDRLRALPRMAGRAAVAVDGGSCGGCRVDLPVMEYRRVRDEPADAVVTCVHCGRLFVR
jgi:predicted  nucleic acid-binding Zn-ribbon protein